MTAEFKVELVHSNVSYSSVFTARALALRALVNSVALNGQKEESSDIEKATKVQMLNLSNKLGEVFGEGAAAANDGAGRNAKGEVCPSAVEVVHLLISHTLACECRGSAHYRH